MKSDPFGILVVDKEKNMTSHDVVDLVRRKFKIKKVGHAGTLDPNATGVLVLLVGNATKLSDKFLNQDKEYVATMKLGERTDTGDSDGKIIGTFDVRVSQKKAKDVMAEFVGEIDQVPPMVSAKRVNGKRLYKIARKGLEVERRPRKVVIKELVPLDIKLPLVTFRVACSKGTYIRQLADDIGGKLGCGAHLTELKRTRSGPFSLEQAVPLSTLSGMNWDALDENIIRIQK
ncbi:MAG: tRNA pseudouridine(55) synthase TruB [Candidatus Omnitrophota bacterium]